MITAKDAREISEKYNGYNNASYGAYSHILRLASQGFDEVNLSYPKECYKNKATRPDLIIDELEKKGFKVHWKEYKWKVEFIISWSE